MMKHTGTLIAVKDMEKSRQFYHDMLGLEVATDFGANVTLTGGLVLQTLETWQSFIHTGDVTLKSNAGELYFETEDMDAFYEHLESFDILYVHKLHEHPWGQRVVRFYDPDGHIIETAEKLDAVIAHFTAQGMSPDETADRMVIPLDFVVSSLNGSK